MIPQRVQRQRTKGWRKPEGAVYVGRGSRWGNPLMVCEMWPTAEQVVSLFRDLVAAGEAWWTSDEGTRWEQRNRWRLEAHEREWLNSEAIRAELAGKDLMCWCPLHKPCHADVLLELANGDRLPVGTPVLFWPGARRGEGRRSVTRTPIWKMGSGTEVVSVEGYPGGIALTHIEPITESETA